MISKEKPADFNKRFDIVGCFLKHDNKFLLLRRQPHKANGDAWGLPAGKKEENESIEQAVLREVEEETGVKLSASDVQYLTRCMLEMATSILSGTCFQQRLIICLL